jgi:hypothetical protein
MILARKSVHVSHSKTPNKIRTQFHKLRIDFITSHGDVETKITTPTSCIESSAGLDCRYGYQQVLVLESGRAKREKGE